MRIHLLSFHIIIFFMSFSLQAEWFESQGQAYINNTPEIARTKAIENALKKTLLVAGASISSVQQVVNGLLTTDELNIRSAGVVNAFEVVSEKRLGSNIIEVTIRADIFPQEEYEQCYSVNYRKPILLTRSRLIHRGQANIGGIYGIDSAVTTKLSDHIKESSRYLNAQMSIRTSTPFFRLNKSYQQEEVKKLTKSLATHTENQFVIYSEITDISINQGPSNGWKLWKKTPPNRDFNLIMYIYDGFTGDLVFEKQYFTSAPWRLNKRENINPNGSKFWGSAYGAGIDSLLKNITLDIDEALMCQPSQATIVDIDEEKLIINIGKYHGVKLGDEFSLLLNTSFTLDNGNNYTGYNLSPYKVKVISLDRNNAIVEAVNAERLGNVQINDLVVRY